jgi:DNA processing protein
MKFNHPISCISSDSFSEALSSIPNPPDSLFAIGNVALLKKEALAIVGARRASPYGLRAASFYARQLAQQRYVIISGLARGIDSMAHAAALQQDGETIAVLGHGLDQIYPPENASLAREILAKGGCLISEYAAGVPPLARHFPERNRLISGLSLGTLVIEASEKSGSLITARMALEQGRELFALSSYFDQKSFSGSHRLLQCGAKLITCVEDILEELPPRKRESKASPSQQEAVVERATSVWPSHLKDEEMVSLGEILASSSRAFDELLPILKKSIESGEIAEVYPQHFIRLLDPLDAKPENELLPN